MQQMLKNSKLGSEIAPVTDLKWLPHLAKNVGISRFYYECSLSNSFLLLLQHVHAVHALERLQSCSSKFLLSQIINFTVIQIKGLELQIFR